MARKKTIGKWKKLVVQILIFGEIFGANFPISLAETSSIIPPSNIIPKGSAEYFSSKPDASLLIPVYIWGEVTQPGLHYVPFNSNLSQVLSSAGGPTGSASLPEIRLIRESKISYVDLFEKGNSEILKKQDAIYVEKSVRSDLPIIFAGMTTLLAVVSLYISVSNKK